MQRLEPGARTAPFGRGTLFGTNSRSTIQAGDYLESDDRVSSWIGKVPLCNGQDSIVSWSSGGEGSHWNSKLSVHTVPKLRNGELDDSSSTTATSTREADSDTQRSFTPTLEFDFEEDDESRPSIATIAVAVACPSPDKYLARHLKKSSSSCEATHQRRDVKQPQSVQDIRDYLEATRKERDEAVSLSQRYKSELDDATSKANRAQAELLSRTDHFNAYKAAKEEEIASLNNQQQQDLAFQQEGFERTVFDLRSDLKDANDELHGTRKELNQVSESRAQLRAEFRANEDESGEARQLHQEATRRLERDLEQLRHENARIHEQYSDVLRQSNEANANKSRLKSRDSHAATKEVGDSEEEAQSNQESDVRRFQQHFEIAWAEQTAALPSMYPVGPRYIKTETIACGGHGVVSRAFMEVAVKEPWQGNHDDLRILLMEHTNQKSIGDHRNVVKVLGAVNTTTACGQPGLDVLMEYVPWTLKQEVEKRGRWLLHEDAIWVIVQDILQGLEHIHGHGLYHRDIKPDNIVITRHGAAKLADFGTSRRDSSPQQHCGYVDPYDANIWVTGLAGTLAFMSPEALNGKYCKGADLWALACTIIFMASGKLPWSELEATWGPVGEEDQLDNYKEVVQSGLVPDIPEHLSSKLKVILGQWFAFCPEDRGSAASALRDHFSTGHMQPPPVAGGGGD